MHDAKAHPKPAQDWPQYAAHRALLAPYLAGVGLRLPQIAPVEITVGHLGGVSPCVDELQFARFVDNPIPWNRAVLARDLERAVDDVHFAHAVYETGSE